MLVSNCGLPKALSHGFRWTFGESRLFWLFLPRAEARGNNVIYQYLFNQRISSLRLRALCGLFFCFFTFYFPALCAGPALLRSRMPFT